MWVNASGTGEHLPWGLAWRLATGQLLSWGILYYAFTVVVGPMQAATGWSRSFLNAGLALGLLTWGVGACGVGWWIQRRGGRGIMALASVVGGGALVLMGCATSPPAYLAAWFLLGLAMAGLLYEPAFAVIVSCFGPHYRRGITLVTLVGGLAGTVFIPLTQWAIDHLGWREALILLGVLQIAICGPLHGLGLPGRVVRGQGPGSGIRGEASVLFGVEWRGLGRDFGDRRFIGLAIWFSAHGAAVTGLTFQLVPVLRANGVSTAEILLTMALVGPMQLVGRLALAATGDRSSSIHAGAWAMAGLAVSIVVLLALPPTRVSLALFAVLFGAGNGVLTIVRGAVVAETFGPARYAEIAGALALPTVAAKAAAPLLLAMAWDGVSAPEVIVLTVLALIACGVVGLCVVARTGGHVMHDAMPVRCPNDLRPL